MRRDFLGFGALTLLTVLLIAACTGGAPSNSTPSPGRSSTAEATIAPTPSRTATPQDSATGTMPAGTSGIEGIVLAGPACPVERIDSPCPDRPVAVTIAVFSGTSDVDVVAQVTSGPDGRFRLALGPGTYTLRGPCVGTMVCSPYPRIIPQTLIVLPDELTHVTVHADTGIR